MTKKEIIENLVGHEFYFTDYGICGLRKNGTIISWGEPCKVDLDGWGNYVIANLYKLPKKWAIAVQHSVLHDQWRHPDDEETMYYDMEYMLKEEEK